MTTLWPGTWLSGSERRSLVFSNSLSPGEGLGGAQREGGGGRAVTDEAEVEAEVGAEVER